MTNSRPYTYLRLLFLVTIVLVFQANDSLAQEVDLDQFYDSSSAHNSLGSSSKDRLDSLYVAYLREHNITEDNGAYEEFIYDYNFFLEKLNKSGKVFSGDVLTKYLNQMKDEILNEHPKKESINVYVTNFDQLNAFTNDFGNIYVNVATIAKVDSEMKLRVILAHEIAHVLMRHSFKMANLDNHFSNDKFERINQISDFDTHQFSQKQELEADSIAYDLLKGLGYDISNLDDLFENLKYSRNPVFDSPVDIYSLCLSGNEIQQEYLGRVDMKVREEDIFAEFEENDSLSTHPSAEARKELYQRIWENSTDSLEQTSGSDNQFERYRLLAAHVLARTLTTEHKYIEGLYLVVQLMDKYPEDASLSKLYLKLQLLITQSKYMFSESSIVNNYSNSCTDSNYLFFRRGVLSIPALEMNLITLSNIEAVQLKSADQYLNRLTDFSHKFLYKYNPEIITKKDGELVLSSEGVRIEERSKKPLLSSEQKKNYKEIEEEGYILVGTLVRGEELIADCIQNFDQYDQFSKSLYSYRASRDQFEKMLTIDEFIVDFDPDESYKKYRKGESSRVNPIPESSITALVQSDTYVFSRGEDGMREIDVKMTLETEELITELFKEENYFSKDLTNLNQSNQAVSIRDNYVHYLLTNWIGECLYFEDIVYSVADEEIMEYLESVNTEYLVYNFNILNKSGYSSRFRCLYYNLYFDLKTMGVSYVSAIASSKKPKKEYLKHYFHQAHFGKSSL